jgi:hypothetical protein
MVEKPLGISPVSKSVGAKQLSIVVVCRTVLYVAKSERKSERCVYGARFTVTLVFNPCCTVSGLPYDSRILVFKPYCTVTGLPYDGRLRSEFIYESYINVTIHALLLLLRT